MLKHCHYKIIMQYNKNIKICLFMNITHLIHRIRYVILYKITFKKYCTIICICSCTSKHCSYYNQTTQFCKIVSPMTSMVEDKKYAWPSLFYLTCSVHIYTHTNKQTDTFHRSKICSMMTEYETGRNNTWCSHTISSQDTN